MPFRMISAICLLLGELTHSSTARLEIGLQCVLPGYSIYRSISMCAAAGRRKNGAFLIKVFRWMKWARSSKDNGDCRRSISLCSSARFLLVCCCVWHFTLLLQISTPDRFILYPFNAMLPFHHSAFACGGGARCDSQQHWELD